MEAKRSHPFEPVLAMMIENFEKARSAMQNHGELIEKNVRGFPYGNEEQISAFKAYVERRVASSHAFVDKLLRAKDFQEAARIQVKYFQSELKAVAEDAAHFGAKMASSFNRRTD